MRGSVGRRRIVNGEVIDRLNPNLDWLFDNCAPEPNSGCWLWTGRSNDGYGEIRHGTRSRRTHRVAYALANGPIPDGMCVCHRCDVRLCINPGHLFLGTNAENTKDRTAKGRSHRWGGSRRGSNNPCAKLTEERVASLKVLLSSGLSYRVIAKRFGISGTTVCEIASGHLWSHVKASPTSEGSSHV